MHPAEPRNPDAGPLKGLPPVVAPSGVFIAQLFLVPLAIVGGIALVFFGIIWLFGDVLGLGGARTPAQFLDKLDKSNPDVRWRAASDLAQVLLRDNRLASNPHFALDLADRLRRTIDAAAPTEQAIAKRLQDHPHLVERLSKRVQDQTDRERDSADKEWQALESDWKKLEPDLNYIFYLSACLGNFMLPTGAPLLSELAGKESAEVNIIEALERRRAVWALANLGENLKRFDRLAPEQREAILDDLDEEAGGLSTRADWARAARDALKARQEGGRRTGALRAAALVATVADSQRPATVLPAQVLADKLALDGPPRTMGVADALVRCAEDKRDPFLRELAGYAMGLWEGSLREDWLMDQALLRLTQDGGQGNDLLAKLFVNQQDKDKDSVPVTRDPGVMIQYNAAAALARRGSAEARLDMLEDMLNEELQKEMHLLRRKDESKTLDEATAYLTVLATLKAVGELHARRPDKLAERPSLREAIDKLRHSKNPLVRTEAERVWIALGPNSQ